MHLPLIQKITTYASSNREHKFYTGPYFMKVFQAHSFCCVAPVGLANFELKSCQSIFGDKNMSEVNKLGSAQGILAKFGRKNKLGKQGHNSLTILILH